MVFHEWTTSELVEISSLCINYVKPTKSRLCLGKNGIDCINYALFTIAMNKHEIQSLSLGILYDVNHQLEKLLVGFLPFVWEQCGSNGISIVSDLPTKDKNLIKWVRSYREGTVEK